MKGGTLFSGIGSPECSTPDIDWRWSAERDPFASAVLAARFPDTVNVGCVEIAPWGEVEHVDVVVFGSPCQSFSVAGRRSGLDDPRGNLTLVALGIVGRLKPRWLVWENVPGVLSIDGGRTFGAVLGLMGQLGYGFAYRVLDARWFGVPQRRSRVFVVGCLGDWRRAAAVLFEPASLFGNHPPGPETRQGVARPLASGSRRGSGYRNDADTADNLIAHALRAEGFDASEDGTGRGTPLVPVAINAGQDPIVSDAALPLSHDGFAQAVAFAENSRAEVRLEGGDGHVVGSLKTGGGKPGQSYPVIAFSAKDSGGDADDVAPTLRSGTHDKSHANAWVMPGIAHMGGVRRLTPRECERLQGFPDDWTLIPVKKVRRERLASPKADRRYREIGGEVWQLAADGPRYRALGNSMAVPVMRWILRRVAFVDSIS